jgi:hypothetical protein
MNPLSSRKQLLIAESELNRAQLLQEWQTLAAEGCALANQAKTLRSIVSASASLVTGLMSFRHKKEPAPAGEKPSWLQTVLKGAGLVSSFWQAFRPHGDGQKEG